MGVQERRQREREARRKSVLDAARRLVRERGYQGMTTKQIANECELSEATVFWYFHSKEEIFTSLLFEAIDFMQREIELLARRAREGAGSQASPDPEVVLRDLWDVFRRLRDEYPEYFHVFTSLATPAATGAVSDEVKQDLVRRSGDNFRLVAELLNGPLGSDRARAAVDATWGLFVGLGVLQESRVNLGAPIGDQSRQVDIGVEVLLPGLVYGPAASR